MQELVTDVLEGAGGIKQSRWLYLELGNCRKLRQPQRLRHKAKAVFWSLFVCVAVATPTVLGHSTASEPVLGLAPHCCRGITVNTLLPWACCARA